MLKYYLIFASQLLFSGFYLCKLKVCDIWAVAWTKQVTERHHLGLQKDIMSFFQFSDIL